MNDMEGLTKTAIGLIMDERTGGLEGELTAGQKVRARAEALVENTRPDAEIIYLDFKKRKRISSSSAPSANLESDS